MGNSVRKKASFGTALNNTTSLFAAAAIGLLTTFTAPSEAEAQDSSVKVGFVTFLSGGAAGPFGVPARNAAELMIEAINAGTVPGPYNTAGIGGSMIDPIFVDENSKQKNADYLKLVEKDGVEMVIGYVSSGSCKAIAPEAEKAERLTILFDCGTPQIFEEIVTDPQYTFRTGGHGRHWLQRSWQNNFRQHGDRVSQAHVRGYHLPRKEHRGSPNTRRHQARYLQVVSDSAALS